MAHDTRIGNQSGISLADQYDVPGSIAGLHRLDTEEVKTVHDMSATLFAERASGRIFRIATGALTQSVDFEVVGSAMGGTQSRIYGIQVQIDIAIGDVLDIARCAVVARSSETNREIPIWMWNNVDGATIRMDDGTGTLANEVFLVPNPLFTMPPFMLFGPSQPLFVDQIAMRGSTAAFGAGDVTITALVYSAIATDQVSGSESFGVPVPSW